MLLANEFVHDTRVYKQAQSLISWGCDVHVIAIAKPHLPVSEVVDGIHVHRVTLNPDDIFRIGKQLLVWWNRKWLRRMTMPIPAYAPSTGTAPHAAGGIHTNGTVHTNGHVSAPPRRPGYFARLHKRRIEPIKVRLRKRSPTPLRLLALNHRFAVEAIKLEPDVIQSHDLNTLYGGGLVKQLLGVPLVFDSHELFLERNRGENTSKWDRRIWGYIQKRFIRNCDAVMSVADGICRHLEKQYSIPRPHLVRNTQPYEPPAPRSRLLADDLDIPYDMKILIYPGAITANRGLEVLIDSAAQFDNAAAVIMGYARNQAYLDELIERARERGVLNRTLYFRDAVPIDKVVEYVASADLGVVPTQNVCLSYFYESSNKIFHCMMAGVPLAMSDHAEKRQLVEEYGIGVLFDETDPAAIAASINDLLADQAQYDVMSQNCLDAACTMNWEHEEHKLRTMFAALIGDRLPPVPPVAPHTAVPDIITLRRTSGIPAP
jgi:glycosyltransferase involved in cell wall biosynthesis